MIAHIDVEYEIERGISSWRKRFSVGPVFDPGRSQWPWVFAGGGSRKRCWRIDQSGNLLFRQTKKKKNRRTGAPFFVLTSSPMIMKEPPTSPTAPLAAFPPQPEGYRSRASEFYGFVAWSSTYLLFTLFILWGFLPDEWILWSGVSWYPNRYIRPTLSFRSI